MNDRIKERIRKLLKIAEDSPYPAEVETALLKAQELMALNGLEDGDIDPSERGDVVEKDIDLGGRVESWKGYLSIVLAENFRCMTYRSRRVRHGDNGAPAVSYSVVVILGRGEDVKIVFDAFCKCVTAVSRFAMEYRKRTEERWRTVRNSYFMGFVRGLEDRFEEQRKKNPEWGLVLVRDPEVESAYEALGLKNGGASRTVLRGQNAYADGYARGKGFSLEDDPSLREAASLKIAAT
ncbi:conserved hypothetical protein [Dethiosulfovibrio peptidovorans DSM 11002]|uniref:Uncharacterized protein n=1 Tax=Dethiosulfovibrio peptidovorans DSM 11002 TaxID=469381 RepID=D2Z3T4_9BACT|nr:DUF2786 domain-containing protein [Dethiosulfovibrio peptidovorans]EFC90390.1 conserved hypothetical protein [Dethiosulfovibrio peptidovorans DSM 11002]